MMDIKKVVENKYPNWELTPKKKGNADALKSAEKTPISFSDVQKKFTTNAAEANIQPQSEQGIDRNWTSVFLTPKNKSSDAPIDTKMRFLNDDGDEVAAQG